MLRKQHKVDASHYDMPLIYYTEGHSLHFGRPEFALITGLPFGHVNFGLYTSGELKFRNRVFPHKLGLSVTNLDVIGVIEDEETFQKLCDQDSIRLCLILCLEVIFMGRLLTCPVDDTLFRLVESLEDWNCFPWGEHIWTHLYDQIQNVIEKHSDEHYFGMKRDRMYVPTYTLSGFVFAFQVWIFESFERCNCWWIKDPNVIPRAVGWSKKSIFNRSDCGYLFAKVRAEELRLCLEAEERMHLEHEKNIIEEQRFRVNEAKRMKLEEEKRLEISELKTKRRQEFMNSTHVKSILGKLTHTKGNQVNRYAWDNKKPLREGKIKCKFPWSDDYTIAHDFAPPILVYMHNGDKYVTPWSDVDQVFLPINEAAHHWCLAHFDILSGLVTFYDSGDTYDYCVFDLYVRVRECL
ncbi:phospholipase-like protein [Tanacetum coccineum]